MNNTNDATRGATASMETGCAWAGLAARTRPGARHLVSSLLLPLALALTGCADEKPAPPAADATAGKAVAEAKCAACHALDGRSAAPGIPHLAGQVDKYLAESLAAYKQGKRHHAALRDMAADLSEADVRNVIAYYASLPPLANDSGQPIKVISPYDKGKAAAAACASCHNADGNSTQPGVPSLAGQQPMYFISAVRAYLHGTRSKRSMQMLRELTRVDLESLALYYATQQPARRAAPMVGVAAAGEPLTAKCGGCHGAHGVSNDAMTPSLAGQDPEYLVNAIRSYSNHGRAHGPMLVDASESELQDIAAFYATQESRPAEARTDTVKDLVAKCERCHGPDIENPNLAIPKIAGQDVDYLKLAMRAYRDGKRESSLMHNMSLPYSEALIEAVASTYAAQAAR